MPSDFVHLHLHTHYSMLDGACTVKGLLQLAQEHEMNAMAITDHGYMGGVEEFHQVLSGAGSTRSSASKPTSPPATCATSTRTSLSTAAVST